MSSILSYEQALQVAVQLTKDNATFHQIFKDINSLIGSNSISLVASYWIYFLLPELKAAQRLMIYYVLALNNQTTTSTINGFAIPLLDWLDSTRSNQVESYFIWQLLSSATQFTSEIKELTPEQCLQRITVKLAADTNHQQSQQQQQQHMINEMTTGLKTLRFESKLYVTSADCMRSVAVPPFMSMQNSPVGGASMEGWTEASVKRVWEIFSGYITNASSQDLQPRFTQLPPPLMDLCDDELLWDDSYADDAACLLWDSSAPPFQSDGTININANTSKVKSNEEGSEAYLSTLSLLRKAPTTALTPRQQSLVVQFLAAHPTTLAEIEFGPDTVPGLAENNSSICAAFLYALISSQRKKDNTSNLNDHSHNNADASAPEWLVAPVMSYLMPLITANFTLSQKSIEIVSDLCEKSAVFPSEFLQQYTVSCIATCDRIIDKLPQSRYVRMVSLLLKGLLKSYPAEMRPLSVEIQTFCLSFPTVKEATLLYGMIKANSSGVY